MLFFAGDFYLIDIVFDWGFGFSVSLFWYFAIQEKYLLCYDFSVLRCRPEALNVR